MAKSGSSGQGVALDEPSGGHVMKLRYTPMQRDVLAVESPESPHHAEMSQARGLTGMPVMCCGLHSQVPLVAAAVKQQMPEARIAYCMTDAASLALPLSEVVRASVSAKAEVQARSVAAFLRQEANRASGRGRPGGAHSCGPRVDRDPPRRF